MRKNIVAGNWKMNKTFNEGLSLASEIVNMVKDEVSKEHVEVILAPPFTHLSAIGKLVAGNPKVALAAQNCSQFESGAYTGEVAANMLASVGASYVIVGHSERREYFREDNATLAKKVNIALQNNLKVIFCCGEPLEIRENETFFDFIKNQLQESVFHLSEEQFKNLVIAYEPIWAIGTGKTASAEQAQEVHAFVRKEIASKYGEAVAQSTSILYGGSCKPSNAQELFACADVDGGLIGGASLQSRDFVDIAKSF